MKTALAAFILLSLVNACAPLIDSPFSDQLQRPERVMNESTIRDLSGIEDDSLLRFAVFTDSHQNYAELRQMITQINDEPQLDFVASLGDFTNSGYNFEYDEFISAFAGIRYPAVTAIGNHDSIGAGPELFKRAFGPVNFHFDSAGWRLIFFNTNDIENPADFSPQWLKDRIDETSKNVLIFCHVSLRDSERFNGNVATVFEAVIADSKVKAVFNGHDHVFMHGSDNGTLMIQAARVMATTGVHWLKVSIQAGQLCLQQMDTGESNCFPLK